MPIEGPVSSDDPLMIAWKAYRATEDAKNTERWARSMTVDSRSDDGMTVLNQPHLEGSLWAAFAAGYKAGIARKAGE